MENLGEAPVAKPGYSSGLVCKESRKPQVAGSNPARGSIAKKMLRTFFRSNEKRYDELKTASP
jgi:hypothetical protein